MSSRGLRLAAVMMGALLAALPLEAKTVVALSPLSADSSLEVEQSAVFAVVQAELSMSTNITLVDRDQMHRVLEEFKLGQQGMLAPESARQIGAVVGARYFCSGTLGKVGDRVMVTAKVIDVQTTLTKLAYAFLKSKDDSEDAGKVLAERIENVVSQFEVERTSREQIVATGAKSNAKPIPAEWKRPAVMLIIPEMHVRQPVLIDPAAETELTKRLIDAGFKVIDSEYVRLSKADAQQARRLFGSLKTATQYAAEKKADLLLYGEAISEHGATLGDFEGCRARVELKAIDVKTDEILLADSAEGGATDLAETVAGKKAIQQAANRLADGFLYPLAEKWHLRAH